MLARLTTRLLAAVATALIGMLGWSGTAFAANPGSLDSTFGGSGVVALGSVQLFGVAVAPDGQVIAAGSSGGRVFVERLTAAGVPAGSYTGPSGTARGVAVAPGGKIVLAGTSGGAMFVERLTAALAPDPSFGSGGVATAFAGSGVANGVAVASDGSVAAAGASANASGSITAVARFTASGALQWTQSGFGGTASLNGVAIQGDGKVVAVGVQDAGRLTNGLIARLTTTGALDSAFNNHGAFTYSYPNSGYTALQAVTLQVNGQIVIGGVAETPEAVVVRLNGDGTLDSGFGTAGTGSQASGADVLVPDFPLGAFGVGIAGGGRVVAAGNYAVTGTELDEGLYAFTPAGAAETAFIGGSGTSSQSPGTVRGPTGADEACALAIAPDGSLVTVGNGVTSLPDSNPCSDADVNGYVARYVGFGPPPAGGAPAVTTGAATAVTATGATLTGQVNPNSLTTAYHFEYGSTTAYGSSTADTVVAAGSATATASATLSGLAPHTTYHYRLDAGNLAGTVTGADQTFTTSAATGTPGPPSAVTGAATPAEFGATISGKVNPGNQVTTYKVQFGRTARYGSASATSSLDAGGSRKSVTVKLTNLKASTTYHYRIVASNASGTRRGAGRTFKTLPLLSASIPKLAGSYSIKAVEAGQLSSKIGCNQACGISGSLLITRAQAKALKLGARTRTIGHGRASLRRSGTAKLVVRLTRAAMAALAGSHGLQVSFRLVIKPVGPGKTVTSERTLNLTG